MCRSHLTTLMALTVAASSTLFGVGFLAACAVQLESVIVYYALVLVYDKMLIRRARTLWGCVLAQRSSPRIRMPLAACACCCCLLLCICIKGFANAECEAYLEMRPCNTRRPDTFTHLANSSCGYHASSQPGIDMSVYRSRR